MTRTRPTGTRTVRAAWPAFAGPRLLVVLLPGLLAGLLGGCTNTGEPAADDPLVVGAASYLMGVFTELGDDVEAATGDEVTFTFGSSGQLAQQIREGAPMDVYASADAGFVDAVLAAGIGDADTRTPLGEGRLVLWAPGGASRWPDLRALAADTRVEHVAIANPEHAPYGRAAREALEAAGVWDHLEDRLVLGENIADTQRLAASGNADVAITALALVAAGEETDAQTGAGDAWVLIDADAHAPLTQEVIVVTDDPRRAARARAFVAAVTGPQARDTLRRYGLGADPEPSAAVRQADPTNDAGPVSGAGS